jgi:hypothetical protein
MTVASAVMLVLSGTAFAQSSGTWKLNLAKSTFSPAGAPKSNTITYESTNEGITAIVDMVATDGAVIHYEYTAKYDGMDTRVIGNATGHDTSSRTRINATTTQAVHKKDGKVVTNQTFVESADGKVLTITTTGTSPLGKAVNNVAVYDKQ